MQLPFSDLHALVEVQFRSEISLRVVHKGCRWVESVLRKQLRVTTFNIYYQFLGIGLSI
jgi:hypothetical protein